MSQNYLNLSHFEKIELLEKLKKELQKYKEKNLKLDMSRGKPCSEQLDLSLTMLEVLKKDSKLTTITGIDTRNYGLLDGIPEIKKLYAEILDIDDNCIIAGSSSSLNMMYDALQRGLQFGFNKMLPWNKEENIKFLCPVPGYDRHFALTEIFGIEMITVKMNDDGPDMDTIEKLVKNDPCIKGIWCVPRFSNPTGTVFSDDVIRRLASMETACPNFKIFWDNAYAVHTLYEDAPEILNILHETKKAGNPNRVFLFTSTSKITFPGAGVAIFASSEENINEAKKYLAYQTIGPDKINQLRHAMFLKDKKNLLTHMEKHANILRPKFEKVLEILDNELKDKNYATWTNPKGGYFISVNVVPHTAKRVVELAKEVGVILTPAGASFPKGYDPDDTNIRFAPTLPPIEELKIATEIFAICIKIAALELYFKKTI